MVEEEQHVAKTHPVPQQVFGVEFKLVGDLTLRQFLILAVFGFFAFLLFSLPIFVFLRFLLAGMVFLAGILFALVPFQDQPLDRWLVAFFRAIYAPTRRVWIKSAEPMEFLVMEIPKIVRTVEQAVSPEESRRRLEALLATVKEEGTLTTLDIAENRFLESIKILSRGMLVSAPAPAVSPAIPSVTVTPPLPPPLPEVKFVEVQKIERRPSLASRINFASENVFKVQRGREASYFTARRNIRAGRRLGALAIAGEAVYAPVRERVIEPILPEVPVLPPQAATPAPISTPELAPSEPNIISGTVYDQRGNLLPSALVVVKDKKGNIVRAVKANVLGKFTVSPLPNGTYTLELPKIGAIFAKIGIELIGKLVPPLEVRPS